VTKKDHEIFLLNGPFSMDLAFKRNLQFFGCGGGTYEASNGKIYRKI